MKRAAVEIWVGLFVLAGIVAIAMLALQVGSGSLSSFDDGYRIYARFDDIGGLNVKAPVAISGVKIGRVSNISVDRDTFEAIVELSIAAEYSNIPIDSNALILTAGLLGAKYVGILPGAEDDYLADKSEIDLTQSTFSIENLISEFLFRSTTN